MDNPRAHEAILLSHDASNEHWQLGPLPPREGSITLVGWRTKEGESAVPPLVARVLARALVRYGRVSFPCSTVPTARASGWCPLGADHIQAFPRRLVHGRGLTFAALRDRSELRLLSTVREESVLGLFDDPAYPWWHQGQFALVSRPAESLPDIAPHRGLLGELIEPEWAETLGKLAAIGVDLILRPGVDGDVAGLLCTSLEVRQELEDRIRSAATEFGLACSVASEEVFSAWLAETPRGKR
jgi:hypothetical protein